MRRNALARAIASDKATSGAVRDLVGLVTMTVDSPRMLVSERLVECSRVVCDLTAKLRQDPGVATSNIVAICGLERELAEDFWRRGNHPESRRLLTDALELLVGRRSGADDPDVEPEYARILMRLGWAARDQSDTTRCWSGSMRSPVLEGLAERPQNLEVIVSIDQSQRTIARLFAGRGLEEQRRRVLESHIRMLERLSERAGAPAIGLLVVMTDGPGGRSLVGGAPCRDEETAGEGRLPERLETRVEVWIADDLQPYPSDPKSTGNPQGARPGRPRPAVIRALESRCEALAVYPALFRAAALRVCSMPSIEPRSNETLAAWTMRAGPSHLSPPSARYWHEEIPK